MVDEEELKGTNIVDVEAQIDIPRGGIEPDVVPVTEEYKNDPNVVEQEVDQDPPEDLDDPPDFGDPDTDDKDPEESSKKLIAFTRSVFEAPVDRLFTTPGGKDVLLPVWAKSRESRRCENCEIVEEPQVPDSRFCCHVCQTACCEVAKLVAKPLTIYKYTRDEVEETARVYKITCRIFSDSPKAAILEAPKGVGGPSSTMGASTIFKDGAHSVEAFGVASQDAQKTNAPGSLRIPRTLGDQRLGTMRLRKRRTLVVARRKHPWLLLRTTTLSWMRLICSRISKES
jgi:hypothetical protein